MIMSESFKSEDFVVHREHGCDLSKFPTHEKSLQSLSAEQSHELLAQLGEKIEKLQNVLHSAKQKGLLLVLQGMDTAGKDGVIRRVFSHVSPLGVRAEAFGAPSSQEQAHDYLWRVHSKVPARGEMVIFNRSHYEDVLVTRVRGWIDQAVCERRYEHIRHFEQMLHDEGIVVLKCFLHISKEEQKQRLQARLEDVHKQWKLQPSDFEDRKLWPHFVKAYENAMNATSTEHAPWHVIPADNKHHRDIVVAHLIVKALEGMKLKYPEATFDLAKVKLTD
jgi:PPK2 family polyphosphate:nucleotide phosphotransferase